MKKFSPQQVVEKLRQADVELGNGKNIKEACRVIEISECTYYRWRHESATDKGAQGSPEGQPTPPQNNRRSTY